MMISKFVHINEELKERRRRRRHRDFTRSSFATTKLKVG